MISNKKTTIQEIALEFLQKRNDETFRKIISRLKPGLLSHTFRFVNNTEISKEIVEKTFISVWEKIDQYKREYNFSTWVYAIAKNEALGQLRTIRKMLSHDKLTENSSKILKDFSPVFNMDIEVFGPKNEEITYNLYDKTIDEIYGLEEPYKTVMVEREINQKSLQDIAAELNWNLSTVKTRIRKARSVIAENIRKKHSSLLELYYEEQNS